MYNVSNKKPGDTVTQCIKVTYTGSLDSDVKLYTSSSIGSLGPYIDLQVRPGSGNPTFPGCTGFTPDAADLYNDTLANFPTELRRRDPRLRPRVEHEVGRRATPSSTASR